jgi:hypothetical protein
VTTTAQLVPSQGVRLEYRKRMYWLRLEDNRLVMYCEYGTGQYKRASYFLTWKSPHEYHVYSVRTGKQMPGRICCYMRQGYPPVPQFPKVPLWKEG